MATLPLENTMKSLLDLIRYSSLSSLALNSCIALSATGLLVAGCGDDEGSSSNPGSAGSTAGSGGSGTGEAGSSANDAGLGGVGANGGGDMGGAGGRVMEGTAGMTLTDNTAGTDTGNGGNAAADAGATGGVLGPVGFDCGAAANPRVPNIQLTPFVDGLSRPLLVVPEPIATDATELPTVQRLYVLEQTGGVRLVIDGELQADDFMQLNPGGGANRVQTTGNGGDEQGLLGLAFHPDFQNNGLLYVNYTTVGGGLPGADAGDTVVSEFRVNLDGDRNTVDLSTERVVLTVPQPEGNHNGGAIVFGPDGMLYIGMGDGGGGNDQHGPIGNGQNLNTLLGKILRVDVNVPAGSDEPYVIPADNPFVNQDGADEIWSFGIRNPWRFTFDACTDDMYIGDVGQNALEEIDFEPANTPGRNYGWRCAEGDQDTTNACGGVDRSTFIEPVVVQNRLVTRSITGGYVYRGSAIPDLRGTYLYADYATAEFFSLRMENGILAAGSDETITANINGGGAQAIASFGQDNAGEMYVVTLGGAVFRIDAAD